MQHETNNGRDLATADEQYRWLLGEGTPQAFNELISLAGRDFMRVWAHVICDKLASTKRRRTDVEDVLQDVLAGLHSKLQDDPTYCKNWNSIRNVGCTIARRTAIKAATSRTEGPTVLVSPELQNDTDPNEVLSDIAGSLDDSPLRPDQIAEAREVQAMIDAYDNAVLENARRLARKTRKTIEGWIDWHSFRDLAAARGVDPYVIRVETLDFKLNLDHRKAEIIQALEDAGRDWRRLWDSLYREGPSMRLFLDLRERV